jgi:phosphoribosylanthranilate isomerase
LPQTIWVIFYPPSKRYLLNQPNQPAIIQAMSQFPSNINKVGVFVNETLQNIIDYTKTYHLQYAQLHGTESPAFCESLKQHGIQIIKAFSITEDFNFNSTQPYLPFVDIFLFDTATPQMGGSGHTFNWQILQNYSATKPFLLAGGISPQNINQAQQISHPQLLGFDINSKFESSPGLKDTQIVQQAITTIHNYSLNSTKK